VKDRSHETILKSSIERTPPGRNASDNETVDSSMPIQHHYGAQHKGESQRSGKSGKQDHYLQHSTNHSNQQSGGKIIYKGDMSPESNYLNTGQEEKPYIDKTKVRNYMKYFE
jgi:hypothetical protein